MVILGELDLRKVVDGDVDHDKVVDGDRGKVMSHRANKLHMPYLTISI